MHCDSAMEGSPSYWFTPRSHGGFFHLLLWELLRTRMLCYKKSVSKGSTPPKKTLFAESFLRFITHSWVLSFSTLSGTPGEGVLPSDPEPTEHHIISLCWWLILLQFYSPVRWVLFYFTLREVLERKANIKASIKKLLCSAVFLQALSKLCSGQMWGIHKLQLALVGLKVSWSKLIRVMSRLIEERLFCSCH